MEGQVDDEVKQARRDELTSIFQSAAGRWARAQVGHTLRVIVDRVEGGDAIGRTDADAPDIDGTVRLPGYDLTPGTVLQAEVVAADEMEIVARPAGSSLAEQIASLG